jgi:hypothetical protein
MLKIMRDDGDVLARALAEVDRELHKCGWMPGRPFWISDEMAAIDEELCRDLVCERCGRSGHHYYPAYRTEGRRPQYAFFACCRSCGHWSQG